MIDLETYLNLLAGFFTCYWCGSVHDKDHIAAHVNKCLEEVNWLREHVENASQACCLTFNSTRPQKWTKRIA